MPHPIKITDKNFDSWLNVSRDPTTLASKPELTAQIGITLSLWAKIDYALMDLLISTVPKKGETLNAAIPAMYHSIINMTSRLDLVAAAIRMQRPNHYDDFIGKLNPEIRRRAQERIPIAHGHWAIWDLYPDDLILLPILDFKYRPPLRYTEKDFQQIQGRIRTLAKKVNAFNKRSRPNKF